jgi:hypothetical protein
MAFELALTAPSSGNSAIGFRAGLIGTAAVSLRTIAPAFLLYGTSALVHADAQHQYVPHQHPVRYASGLSSSTASALDLFNRTSIESLVISKLDSIFEDLLAKQEDLDQADYKAIASKLWQLYK